MADSVPNESGRWGKVPDLARELRCSDRYVRKLRESGRLVINQHGWIDIPASVRLIRVTAARPGGGKVAKYAAHAPPVASRHERVDLEGPSASSGARTAQVQPCLLAGRGCGAQANGQPVSCSGWDAADLVMRGFQIGWLAREAANGAPGRIVAFARDLDANLDLYEELGPHLLAAIAEIVGDASSGPEVAAEVAHHVQGVSNR